MKVWTLLLLFVCFLGREVTPNPVPVQQAFGGTEESPPSVRLVGVGMKGPWVPLIWREGSKLCPQRFAVKGGKPASPYLGGKGGKHSFSEFCGTGGFPSVAPLQEGQVIVRPEPNAEMGTGQASLVLVSSSSRLVFISSSSRLRSSFVVSRSQ